MYQSVANITFASATVAQVPSEAVSLPTPAADYEAGLSKICIPSESCGTGQLRLKNFKNSIRAGRLRN